MSFSSGWRPNFIQYLSEKDVKRIAKLARGLGLPATTLRSPDTFLSLGMDWASVETILLALTLNERQIAGEDPRTPSVVHGLIADSARWLIAGRRFKLFVDEEGIPPGHYGQNFSELFSNDKKFEREWSPASVEAWWSIGWVEPLTREQARAICVAVLEDGLVPQAELGDPSLGVEVTFDLEAARLLRPRLERNHKWIHENGFDPNPEQFLVYAFDEWELWLSGIRERPNFAEEDR